MAASKPSEGKMYPNRVQEDQDVEMEPIKLGTPPYSSDDPTTDGLRMLPLEEGSSSTGHKNDETASDVDPDERKAADWVEFVNNTTDQDELDAVVSEYEDSGADYKTVKDAIDKKQADFDDEE